MPLSKVINSGRYDHPQSMACTRSWRPTRSDKHVFSETQSPVKSYRKGLQSIQAAYGLSRLGLINRNTQGIGVGAGHEAVIFWLADRCQDVIATDLYGNTEWSSVQGREADGAVLADPQQMLPRKFCNRAGAQFTSANGRRLPFRSRIILTSAGHYLQSNTLVDTPLPGRASAGNGPRCSAGRDRLCSATEFLLLPEQTHPEFFNREEMGEVYYCGEP